MAAGSLRELFVEELRDMYVGLCAYVHRTVSPGRPKAKAKLPMREDLMRKVDDVLDRVEHATIATVSTDARPWNTPVYFARHRNSLYWVSRREAQHSQNIRQNGHAFIVVFDSSREDETGAGVYFEAVVAELTHDDAIRGALELIYRRRNKSLPLASQFSRDSAHAVYHAHVVRMWTNVLHAAAEIPWDERVEIKPF